MKKSVKKLLLGSSLALAGAAAVTALYKKSAKKLVGLALDREEPKIVTDNKAKISGSAVSEEVAEAVVSAAQKLENSGCETVEITSRDGVKLVGHLQICENPKRIIVAMHGWRSSWSRDFGIISDFWHNNGCTVLYAEQRGQGESGGDYMGFGLLERYDCLDWVNWINEKSEGKLPIYLGGISMGATTVLMATGLELPENVKGVVADCGFTSPKAIWKHVIENNMHIPYGLYSARVGDICKEKIQAEADSYSTVDAMKNCKIPILFIHGTDDAFVPVEMTYENFKACAAPKKLFVVPGADHGMSYWLDREGYEENVKEFWKKYD